MKYLYVGVVGSRQFGNYSMMADFLDEMFPQEDYDAKICIVSGGARGADQYAKSYAINSGHQYVEVPALWDSQGKAAGFNRNPVIVDISNVVVAFWDEKSNGTKHTVTVARNTNTPLIIVNYETSEVKSENI